MRRRSRFKSKDYDMGDGFWIVAESHNNWTEYTACHLDAPGGYVQNRRSFHSCYRREAEAKIKEWKAKDEHHRKLAAQNWTEGGVFLGTD